jgi:hypothetical protein
MSAAKFGRNSELSDPLLSVLASVPRSSPTRLSLVVSPAFLSIGFFLSCVGRTLNGFQALVVVD